MKILFDRDWELLQERLDRLEKAAFMQVHSPHRMTGEVIPVSTFCQDQYYTQKLEWVPAVSTPGYFKKKAEQE